FLFHNAYTIDPADLRKSILTLAAQGKLVPEDPADGPVDSGVRRDTKRTKLTDSQHGPFEVPSNWQWKQLGQISELINGDRSKNYPNKAEYVQAGVPWINTGHIEPDG